MANALHVSLCEQFLADLMARFGTMLPRVDKQQTGSQCEQQSQPN